MKKFICAVLCLSVLITGLMVFTTASASNPVLVNSYSVKISPVRNYLKLTATASGAPAKAGYYSSLLVNVSATYKRGAGLSNAGSKYTNSKYKSASGGWGKGTSSVSVSVNADNNADVFVSGSASATYQYYGIR